MAKSEAREKAIKLRKSGVSIKEIAKRVGVSKSSASIWCREIILSPTQIEKLHKSMVLGSYTGRMKGARMQYERRLQKIKDAEEAGAKMIGALSERDLLISIIALYWGEGSKKKRELAVNNSDPEMIRLMVRAFKKIWGVKIEDFIFRIGINRIHRTRDEEVKNYWIGVTEASVDQFRKTSFIKAKNKKNYSNFATHYGTLTIKVKKSTSIYYSIMGLIKALSKGI